MKQIKIGEIIQQNTTLLMAMNIYGDVVSKRNLSRDYPITDIVGQKVFFGGWHDTSYRSYYTSIDELIRIGFKTEKTMKKVFETFPFNKLFNCDYFITITRKLLL